MKAIKEQYSNDFILNKEYQITSIGNTEAKAANNSVYLSLEMKSKAFEYGIRQFSKNIGYIVDGNDYYLFDEDTGEIIYSRLEDESLKPKPKGQYKERGNTELLNISIEDLTKADFKLLQLIVSCVSKRNIITLNIRHEANLIGMKPSTVTMALANLKRLDIIREQGINLLINPAYAYKGYGQNKATIDWLMTRDY